MGRALRAKVAFANLVASEPVGMVVNRLTGGVVRSRGVRVDTRSDAITNEVRAALFFGFYESAEIRLARTHMRPADNIVDLGSSLGLLTAVAAERLKPGGQVVAVEANPAVLRLGERNLLQHRPGVYSTFVHGAIDYSREVGDETHLANPGHHAASALGAGADTFTAPVVSLGSLLRTHHIDSFTLLSDIEGAEAGLLARDAEALRGCRQIVIELHQATVEDKVLTPADLLEQLLSLGFRLDARHGYSYVLSR